MHGWPKTIGRQVCIGRDVYLTLFVVLRTIGRHVYPSLLVVLPTIGRDVYPTLLVVLPTVDRYVYPTLFVVLPTIGRYVYPTLLVVLPTIGRYVYPTLLVVLSTTFPFVILKSHYTNHSCMKHYHVNALVTLLILWFILYINVHYNALYSIITINLWVLSIYFNKNYTIIILC